MVVSKKTCGKKVDELQNAVKSISWDKGSSICSLLRGVVPSKKTYQKVIFNFLKKLAPSDPQKFLENLYSLSSLVKDKKMVRTFLIKGKKNHLILIGSIQFCLLLTV